MPFVRGFRFPPERGGEMGITRREFALGTAALAAAVPALAGCGAAKGLGASADMWCPHAQYTPEGWFPLSDALLVAAVSGCSLPKWLQYGAACRARRLGASCDWSTSGLRLRRTTLRSRVSPQLVATYQTNECCRNFQRIVANTDMPTKKGGYIWQAKRTLRTGTPLTITSALFEKIGAMMRVVEQTC